MARLISPHPGDVRTQNRVHSGLIPRSAAPEPVEYVLIHPQGDRSLRCGHHDRIIPEVCRQITQLRRRSTHNLLFRRVAEPVEVGPAAARPVRRTVPLLSGRLDAHVDCSSVLTRCAVSRGRLRYGRCRRRSGTLRRLRRSQRCASLHSPASHPPTRPSFRRRSEMRSRNQTLAHVDWRCSCGNPTRNACPSIRKYIQMDKK